MHVSFQLAEEKFKGIQATQKILLISIGCHQSYECKTKLCILFNISTVLVMKDLKHEYCCQNCKGVDIKPLVAASLLFSANRFVVLKTLHNNYTKGF